MEKNLSFEKFEEILKFLQRYDELSEKVDEVANELCEDFPPLNLFGLARKHENHLIDLLKFVFDDEGEWSEIDYWLYELDYGKRYKPGCITEADGTEIKLETIRDLYDYLVYEKERKANRGIYANN